MTLIYVCCVWIAGVYFSRTISAYSPYLWPGVILLGLAAWLFRADRARRFGAILGMVMLLAILRTEAAVPRPLPDSVAFYNNQSAQIRAVISRPPRVEDAKTKLVAEAIELQTESTRLPVTGQVLITTSLYPRFDYGDEIQVEGYLQEPPMLNDFSYRDYLARQGVFSLMYYPKISLLSHGRGSALVSALAAIRKHSLTTIGHLLPDPQAALLSGVLLGEYHALPQRLMESFNATGTSHIIVISGFNITLLATVLVRLFNQWLSRRPAVLCSMAGVAFYTLLVGADPAVSRAALMGGAVLLAVLVGRVAHTLTSLALAVLLMTVWNPLVLWDISFQLSVGATLGLILFASPIYTRVHRMISSAGLPQTALSIARDALIATFAAQVFTLPLILYHFQRLSLIMPLANILVVPVQPLVMASGALSLLAGLIWLPAGQIVSWMAWFFLTYTIRLIELLASFPFASVEIGAIPGGALWAYYGVVLGFVWWQKQSPQCRQDIWRSLTRRLTTKAVLGVLLLVCLIVWAAVFSLPDGRLHVRFLDIGQGDAILVTLPDGKQVLIDGGPSPQALLSELGRAMPFWDRQIELVVLSHPDQDHLLGLLGLVERYQVEHVLDYAGDSNLELFAQWQNELRNRGIPTQKAQAGMTIELDDGIRLDVLHPAPNLLASEMISTNNASTVLRLVYGQVSFLFTGDLEQEGENMLLQTTAPLDSTVLKVSHHGAKEATSEAFVKAVSPQIAVISVGGNRFGHPAPQTLERLANSPVLRTDRSGTIDLQTDGTRLWSNQVIESAE